MSRNFLAIFVLAVSPLLLNSCSTLSAYFGSPSQSYREFVESKVSEAEIFDRARLVVRVRAMHATEDLKAEQEKLSPGHSIELKKQVTQVLVGVEIAGREALQIDELQIYLGALKSNAIKEITHSGIIEQYYPFAFPYLRLFLVDFEGNEAELATGVLSVQTRLGKILLKLKPGAR